MDWDAFNEEHEPLLALATKASISTLPVLSPSVAFMTQLWCLLSQANLLHATVIISSLVNAASCLSMGTALIPNSFGYPSNLLKEAGNRLVFTAVSAIPAY